MTLNTGDNAPRGHNLLQRTLRVLDNGLNTHTLIKNIEDLGGVYAHLMKTGGTRYYLVARATPPMLYQSCPCVSIQRALVLIAGQEDRPILMACWWLQGSRIDLSRGKGTPAWRLYDPKQIYFNALGDNLRNSIWMINFEYHMGREISDPIFIPSHWYAMKKKRVGEQERLPLKSKEIRK